MTTGTWLDEWWRGIIAERRAARLEAAAQDPGTPMWYGTVTGHPTYGPWSAVAAATERKYPSLWNLDRLHRAVLALYGLEP